MELDDDLILAAAHDYAGRHAFTCDQLRDSPQLITLATGVAFRSDEADEMLERSIGRLAANAYVAQAENPWLYTVTDLGRDHLRSIGVTSE